jgi:hypothetical protein
METTPEAPQDKLHPSIENALNEMVKASQNKKPMTKREVFAMAAMQGLCANQFYAGQISIEALKSTSDFSMDKMLAERSVEIADQLIKQLEV